MTDIDKAEIDFAAFRMSMACNLSTDYCVDLIERVLGERPVKINFSEAVAHAILLSKQECYICKKKEHFKFDAKGRSVCYKCSEYKSEPIVFETRKIGRNEPCPCGSGLKYKACCRKLVQ